MGKEGWILTVPGYLVVEEGRIVEHESIWSISRIAGEPLVQIEGQPLEGVGDGAGRLKAVNVGQAIDVQHDQVNILYMTINQINKILAFKQYEFQKNRIILYLFSFKTRSRNMLFRMTNEKGEQQLIEIQTHKLKTYKPNTCLQNFSYMLVRPPRLLYNQDLLDPKKRYGNRFKHSVYYIPFPLSLYEVEDMDYVLLYLHGNSSSRLEGFMELTNLPNNVGLACFDFDGCGNRLQKSFISLGKDQAKQVDKAAIFLKSKGHIVAGWGRSMGSVSALLSSQCKIIIADSPFSSLQTLCQEKSSGKVPCVIKPCYWCLFPCFMSLVDSDIEDKTGTSIKELEIIDSINKNKDRSILFLAGSQDALIEWRHAQRLFDKYQGRKNILVFQGDHNSERPIQILALSHIWIEQQIEHILMQSRQLHIDLFPEKGQNKYLSEMVKTSEQKNAESSGQIIETSGQKAGVNSLAEKVDLIPKES